MDAEDLGRAALAAHALAYSTWLGGVNIDETTRVRRLRNRLKAIALARQGGDLWVKQLANAMVANTLLLDGNHAHARVRLDESLTRSRDSSQTGARSLSR